MGLRALCLVLNDEQAPQRRHSLREVFNALPWPGRRRVANAARWLAARAGGAPARQAPEYAGIMRVETM